MTQVQITLGDLQALGACDPALVAFRERFPDGTSYRELILALVDHTIGVEWWEWLCHRLPNLVTTRNAYETAIKPAAVACGANLKVAREAYWVIICPSRTDNDAYYDAIKYAHGQYYAAKRAALRLVAESM